MWWTSRLGNGSTWGPRSLTKTASSSSPFHLRRACPRECTRSKWSSGICSVYSNQVVKHLICLSCTCTFNDLASLGVIIGLQTLNCMYITLMFVVIRGDHSSADFYLCVLPPKTETVVFSIDGSFTASMSISGKDPKVRPGAVDVVRSVC